MKTLEALSYHPDVTALTGPLIVRAVFERAWHLQSADGWIVTVTAGMHDGPLGVRVRGDDFERVVIRVGDAVVPSPPHPDGTSLSHYRGSSAARGPGTRRYRGSDEVRGPAGGCGGRGGEGRLVLFLETAMAWQHQQSGPPVSMHDLRRDIDQAIDGVCRADRGGLRADLVLGAGTVHGEAWLLRGVDRARDLVRVLANLDAAAARRCVHGLVGLGPGLTPSGDDVLCGLLAGMRVFRTRMQCDLNEPHACSATLRGRYRGATRPETAALQNVPRPEGIALGQMVEEAASRTTSLSRTLLHYARDGVAMQPLLDVLWSLGAKGGVRGVDALLRIGHSSGSDMLTGALLAATAMHEEEAVGLAVGTPP